MLTWCSVYITTSRLAEQKVRKCMWEGPITCSTDCELILYSSSFSGSRSFVRNVCGGWCWQLESSPCPSGSSRDNARCIWAAKQGLQAAPLPSSCCFFLTDLNGIDLTPVQDTPVALRKEDTYVHFNVDIEIQKHVEKLTKGM